MNDIRCRLEHLCKSLETMTSLLLVLPEAIGDGTDAFMAAIAESIRHTNKIANDCLLECSEIEAAVRQREGMK